MSEIWCLLINHRKKPNLGRIFSVNVPANTSVAELKEKIQEKVPRKLHHIDANSLVVLVWRCEVPTAAFGGADKQSCEEQVDRAFSDGKVDALDEVQKMEELRLSDAVALFVQLPAGYDAGECFISSFKYLRVSFHFDSILLFYLHRTTYREAISYALSTFT